MSRFLVRFKVLDLRLPGHSMSGHLAKWGFSSDPHQNSQNFIRGKISGFWAQQSWNFWNRTCISKIMSIWNFDVFREDCTKKFLEFCCWNFNWLSFLYLWIFSFNIFTVKLKAPCWTKERRKFFTGDLWTLDNRCYKATCFSCAFKHDNILNTYNSNSASSIEFILFDVGAGVMEILLYLGHPCLFFNFKQKSCLHNSIYLLKNFL